MLYQVNNDLIVYHGSLGKFDGYNKSAIIVCLDFIPKTVFVSVGIAR